MTTKYRVWIAEDESSVEIIEAFDAESAAEKFVKKYESESADYPVANGDATAEVVVVEHSEDAIPATFSVSGYAEPVYHARLSDRGRMQEENLV